MRICLVKNIMDIFSNNHWTIKTVDQFSRYFKIYSNSKVPLGYKTMSGHSNIYKKIVFLAEIHDWFIDNNIDYNLIYEGISVENTTVEYYDVEILDKNQAMLFKLVWC